MRLGGPAFAQAGRALDTVDADNLDNPTPCSDWTVRQLACHVASGPATWAKMTRGEKVDWSAIPEVPDGEWGATFRSTTRSLRPGSPRCGAA